MSYSRTGAGGKPAPSHSLSDADVVHKEPVPLRAHLKTLHSVGPIGSVNRIAERRQHQSIFHDDLLCLFRGLAAGVHVGHCPKLADRLVELGILEARPGPTSGLVPLGIPDLIEDRGIWRALTFIHEVKIPVAYALDLHRTRDELHGKLNANFTKLLLKNFAHLLVVEDGVTYT